jgi:hypothetical protein
MRSTSLSQAVAPRIGCIRFAQPVGRADVAQQRLELVDEPPPRKFIPCGGTLHELRSLLLGHRRFAPTGRVSGNCWASRMGAQVDKIRIRGVYLPRDGDRAR